MKEFERLEDSDDSGAEGKRSSASHHVALFKVKLVSLQYKTALGTFKKRLALRNVYQLKVCNQAAQFLGDRDWGKVFFEKLDYL